MKYQHFFLIAMVVAGIISGYSATEICKTFIESTKSMVSSMLIVGFTRGILILMKEGMITDTIVYGLVSLLKNTSTYLSAYGMIIIENIVKLFINGSTSAATITMPILAPTAETGWYEPFNCRIGIPVGTQLRRYILADFLRSLLWSDGSAD